MFLSRIFGAPKPTGPRLVAKHDYRQQWDGHRLMIAPSGSMAFVTGENLRDGDIIVAEQGKYIARDVCRCDYSGLHLVRLEPMQ